MLRANIYGLISILERIVSIIIALLFLLSSMAHLANPYYFLSTIYAYELLDQRFGIAVAAILPFIQLNLLFLLLMRRHLLVAYSFSFFLFCIYSSAQLIVYFRGQNITCGCFGPGYDLSIGLRSLTLAGSASVLSMIGMMATFFHSRQRTTT